MKRALVFLIGVACILAVPAQGSAQSKGTVLFNDTCETAFELVPPSEDYPDGPNGNPDRDVSCNQSATETSFGVWYHYYPAEDGTLDVSETSANDIVIAVFEGPDCDNLVETECVDIGDSLMLPVTGSTHYWILVGAWGSSFPPGAVPYEIFFTGPVPVELLAFSVE